MKFIDNCTHQKKFIFILKLVKKKYLRRSQQIVLSSITEVKHSFPNNKHSSPNGSRSCEYANEFGSPSRSSLSFGYNLILTDELGIQLSIISNKAIYSVNPLIDFFLFISSARTFVPDTTQDAMKERMTMFAVSEMSTSFHGSTLELLIWFEFISEIQPILITPIQDLFILKRANKFPYKLASLQQD